MGILNIYIEELVLVLLATVTFQRRYVNPTKAVLEEVGVFNKSSHQIMARGYDAELNKHVKMPTKQRTY